MFCQCGCGQITRVAPNNNKRRGWIKGEHIKFVQGHNSRFAHPMQGRTHSAETINRLRSLPHASGESHPMFGKTHTPEVRKRLSESHKGKKQSAELIAKRVAGRAGYKHSPETLKKIGDGNKGKVMSSEAKRKCSESNKGKRYSPKTEFSKGFSPWIKGRNHSEETKKRLSETRKKLFLNHDFVKKMAKAWNVKPNKPETFILNLLNDIYPGQWKYTGDFSFTINGKCPDFVNCNGQKKIIELFGDYWHRGENPEDRAAIFAPFGYETLVIWERELKSPETVIIKIRNFAEAA